MLKFFALMAVFAATQAQAVGPSITGGGKGVVCRNTDGSVKSVELLDLWEAETLFNRKIVRTDDPVQDQVHAAIQRMADIKVGSFDDPTLISVLHDNNVKMIQDGADVFFGKPWPGQEIQHLHGVTLTLSQDSFEDARPSDCGVEQIVLYKLGASIFYINDDLFDLLPKTDQAALIVHEAFYSLWELGFMKDGTPSSVHSRRAVGYVFSGQSFPAPPDPNSAHITCSATYLRNGSNLQEDIFSLSLVPGTKTVQAAVIWGYPDEPPMGYFERPIKSLTWAADHVESLLTNQECKGQPEGEPFAVAELSGSGPVDFDRNGALVGICKKGKFAPYWSPAGVLPIPRDQIKALTCKRHNWPTH